MIDTSTFTATVGMGLIEAGGTPGGGVMALVARHPRKKAGMEGWVGMTRGTGG
jgi:hypothetical protein